MPEIYDVVVIGAGSVGMPAAISLAKTGLKTLVIEQKSSPGQMNNKKAIGGIRATHSDYGKIKVSLRSIEIFSTWKQEYDHDIDWLSNGYSYPAYSEADETKLKELLKIQKSFGLNIDWISPEEYNELVPGINMNGLRGSTFSPDDGSASPLLTMSAYYYRAKDLGVDFRFDETVIKFERNGSHITSVTTDKGNYPCGWIVNASGNNAAAIGKLLDLDIPVRPDTHEAAITEPVKRFFEPMVVDMRPAADSLNYYFYQSKEGQVIFCITPDPPIYDIDQDSTSVFLPQVAARMIDLYPRLANLKVRRTWRGQYPMTPDGFPIVGMVDDYDNYVHNVGMCGQGFMLGPGMGELVARIVAGEVSEDDRKILRSFDPYRSFEGEEKFK